MNKIKHIKFEEFSKYFYIDGSSKTWLKRKISNSAKYKADTDVGFLHHTGYYDVKLFNKTYRAHRIVYCLSNHADLDQTFQVDHIDGDKLNNNPLNLRLVTNEINGRNQKLRNTNSTGVTGVTRMSNGYGNDYFVARWQEDGIEKCKYFSIDQHGEQVAFDLAVAYRNSTLIRLNEAGYGYTDRHGQPSDDVVDF